MSNSRSGNFLFFQQSPVRQEPEESKVQNPEATSQADIAAIFSDANDYTVFLDQITFNKLEEFHRSTLVYASESERIDYLRTAYFVYTKNMENAEPEQKKLYGCLLEGLMIHINLSADILIEVHNDVVCKLEMAREQTRQALLARHNMELAASMQSRPICRAFGT